ncbi:hypothetical protein TNCV_1874901 [Trichonephila clavipes]|nr:hypothetical protein TNCV_1874901 [Trichonephila clavipes]
MTEPLKKARWAADTPQARLLDLPFDLYQRISATNRVPTLTVCVCVPWTNHNSSTRTNQDIPAETVSKNNSDSVTTPPCHDRPTNQDTLSQADPITSGHIYNLDTGWRNASRSVSQRRPASSIQQKLKRVEGMRSVASYHITVY